MTWTLPENPSNLLIQGTFGCATKNLDVVSGFRSLSQELVLYVDEATSHGSEKAPSDEKQTQHATKTESKRRLHVRLLSLHPRKYAHFKVCPGGDEARVLLCRTKQTSLLLAGPTSSTPYTIPQKAVRH